MDLFFIFVFVLAILSYSLVVRDDLLALLYLMFLVFLSLSHSMSWVSCDT